MKNYQRLNRWIKGLKGYSNVIFGPILGSHHQDTGSLRDVLATLEHSTILLKRLK
ncbi:Hypothetical protein FKW44_007237, partial [Caligus rogercresseyi]